MLSATLKVFLKTWAFKSGINFTVFIRSWGFLEKSLDYTHSRIATQNPPQFDFDELSSYDANQRKSGWAHSSVGQSSGLIIHWS
jgi:hypothetical protein